jgi:hypothetical protein
MYHPWEYNPHYRRNVDERVRKLERRLAETGDPHDAIALYRAQRQVDGPRDHMDHPHFQIEVGSFGPVELIPQGRYVRVMSAGPGHDPVPVVVNRVPYRVSGSFFHYPDLGWIPVRDSEIDSVRRGAFGQKRDRVEYDPTHRWMNSFDLTRINYQHHRQRDASQSAYAKFMRAMDDTFQAWVQDHPGEMRYGALVTANNKIWRLQSDYDKLAQKMAELDAQVAEAIMQEQANK